MTEEERYTQKSVVERLIKIEGADVQFNNEVKFSVENVDGETVVLSVSRKNLILNNNGETLIIPLKNLTECYYFSYDVPELMIETRNVKINIKLTKIEEEE